MKPLASVGFYCVPLLIKKKSSLNCTEFGVENLLPEAFSTILNKTTTKNTQKTHSKQKVKQTTTTTKIYESKFKKM